MNYYEYDPSDIAKSIKKAINEKADPAAVEYLLNERNKKINTDIGAAQYKGDAVTKSAEAYINKYTGVSNDAQRMYDAKRDIAAKELIELSKQSEQIYNAGVGKVRQTYADNRNDLYSAYRRSSLSNEEGLAAMGLGRGVSNAASSGFGETSRMAQLGAYQNSLYNSYKDEAAAVGALAADFAQSNYDARKTYNSKLAQIADESVSRLDDNRDYLYKMERDRVEDNTAITTDTYERALEKLNTIGKVTDEEQARILGLSVGDTTADYESMVFENELEMLRFESDEEQRAFENSLAEKEFANEQEQKLFERAYNLFAGIGRVASEQMAQVLGIPVGTQYWEYVVASKNASSNATSAAASYKNAVTNAELGYLNYEIDKQNADTNFYEEETNRKKLTGDY